MTFTSGSKTDQPKFRHSGQRPTRPKREALDPFSSQTCSSGPQRAPEHTSSSTLDVCLPCFLSCVGSLLSCGIPDLLRLFLQTAAAAATEAPPVTETRAGRSRGSSVPAVQSLRSAAADACMCDAAPMRWTPNRYQALRWCETCELLQTVRDKYLLLYLSPVVRNNAS